MSEREKLAIRVMTLKEAAEIIRKHGGKVLTPCNFPAHVPSSGSRINKVASELDEYIRDLTGDLRRMERAQG